MTESRARWAALLAVAPWLVLACSSSDGAAGATPEPDAGAGFDASPSPTGEGDDTPNPNPTNTVPIVKLADGGTTTIDLDAGDDTPVPPYATRVVSFTPGKCAGFGQSKLPNVVLGPPLGGGDSAGSLDVVSLGKGGEIVLSFEPNAIVDGPGVDLLVFENAFFASGADQPFAEPGEVSVSEDGVTWKTFPCTATAYPWGECAGWHSVSKTDSDSLDPAKVGGDPYDLAELGLTKAKFVRIVDKTQGQTCTTGVTSYGFDLDAIAAVHSERD